MGNLRIRKVAADGRISTVAGGGTHRFAHRVPASELELSDLRGIAVDTSGVLYISEMGAILKVTPDGFSRFVALTSVFSIAPDDPPRVLRSLMTPDVLFPGGFSIDPGGNIWVAETDGAILQISANLNPSPRHRR